MSRFNKIRTDAENLRKRNIELTGEARETEARSTVESAKLKALEEKLASIKAKLATSRVESANS